MLTRNRSKSRTRSRSKSKNRRSRQNSNRRNSKKRSSSRSKRNPCGPGEILRTAFTRKGFTRKTTDGKKIRVGSSRVKETCVKDKGKPGKGPQLIPPLKRGLLSQYGYTMNASEDERRGALDEAAKNLDTLEILRHLRALVTLQRANPSVHDNMIKDFTYFREKYFPHRVGRYIPVGY